VKPVFPALWFSSRGIAALLALAFLLALASVVSWLLVPLYAACAIFVAALAADVALGPSSTALRIVRRPIEPLALGRSATVTYDVVNRATIAIHVGIIETPIEILDFAAPSVEARVAARAQVVAMLALVPRERGLARFGVLYAWVENRIGLLRRRYRIEAAEDVRVLPDLSAVERYGSLAKRNTLIEAGLRRLRFRGAGSEFESLRDYAPGDGFRNVDWKATARP
jgi:uncharacterized protein (DUF58 family)